MTGESAPPDGATSRWHRIRILSVTVAWSSCAATSHKSMLYFEREDGLTNPVEGDLFVEQLKGLASPPLLVVLGSCHSAVIPIDWS